MFEKKNSVGETVSVLREVQDTAWDSKVINMYIMLMYLPLKMQFGTSWGLKCKMEHFLYPSLVSVELELIYTSSLYFLLNLVYFMLTMPK